MLMEPEIGRWKSDNEGLPIGAIRKVVMNLPIKISPKQIDLGEIDVAYRGEIQACRPCFDQRRRLKPS